jgi:hypothetical protein
MNIRQMISSVGGDLLLKLMCNILLIKNLIVVKTLSVDIDPLCTSVMFQDHQLQLFWKVSGCHKIIIDHDLRIPGNVDAVFTKYDPSRTTIHFTFYGIAKQERRTIRLQVAEVLFPEQFNLELSIPDAHSIDYSQQDLAVASHSIVPREGGLPFSKSELSPVFSRQKLVVNVGNLSVHFDPVNLPESIES